jgi:plasmid stabilization system protein ParE
LEEVKYKVRLTSIAKLDVADSALWWAKNRSVEQASLWLEQIHAAMATLRENPERFAVAREDEAFPYTLRQMPFSIGKKTTHRILYRVRDNTVVVYGVRHVKERDVTPKDFRQRRR